jgi:protein tyrosine phosphatase (PTP) superfamily phosphohydrolase (DUF442 family)
MKKKIGFLVLGVVLFFVGKYVYEMNIRHNIETITEGKVYKSGVIPPDEIADYVEEFKIKSIIDLRFPGTDDLVNNPENPEELKAEIAAIQKIKGLRYFNDGSDQVPTQENLDKFYEIMDDKSNYPVLIHCYHGVGRAELYSAVYRIEYENWTNEDARSGIRFLIKFGAFDDGKPKGEFLKAYKTRKQLNLEKK